MDPKYLREKNEEEIDVIELLKRVKEGKAPKEIEVKGIKFDYDEDAGIVQYLYDNLSGNLFNQLITLDTKIKILDKPIIEELNENENVDIYELARKVNQVIKHINKEEK